MMSRIIPVLSIALVAALPLAAAASTAKAQLKDRDGKPVGTVTLEQTPSGTIIEAEFRGLAPGEHAMHIHETGKCEAPGFETAGAHTDPRGHEHGFKNPKGPHAGDLPNFHVPESGSVRVEVFAAGLKLQDGQAGVLDRDGAAVIIHPRGDDYISDPSGDAGNRMACGEIRS